MARDQIVERVNSIVEDFGYAIGEAEDFINREEPHVCDLIDAVAFGKMSSREAKYEWRMVCTKARRDIGEWRGIRVADATQVGFPYLPEPRRIATIVALVPEGAA